MTRIAVNGALGRMGSRIIALARQRHEEFNVVHAFDLKKGSEDLRPYAEGKKTLDCDVLIDFSGPDGALWCNDAANRSGKALVIGSTGLEAETVKAIEATAAKVPVVLSSNMSIGVTVVLKMLEFAATKLGADFNININEAHHEHKKDAPSGTAKTMAEVISRQRKGMQPRDIDIDSKRQGEIVGDHKVVFDGPAETIEVLHHAKSRDIFALGALTAARFAASAKAGRIYTMADVLGV